MNLHGAYFTGDRLSSGLEETFHTANPTDSSTWQPEFHAASEADVKTAMESAESAFQATTDVRFTSVGTAARQRFVRPVCGQDFPAALLSETPKDENPPGIWRTINGILTKNTVAGGSS